MHNSQEFSDRGPTLFDDIGGEALAGSGFETEEPESDTAPTELTRVERQAPAEE